MSRDDVARLRDILASIDTINAYTKDGELADGVVFDAVRMRLIEIGEAVNDVDPAVLAKEPDIPWRDIVGMRNRLTHRYFDTLSAQVGWVINHDLAPLGEAVEKLVAQEGS